MPALSRERILLIGDHDNEVRAALAQAVPSADVKAVAGMFDGIAELTSEHFDTVLAAAEPIERRPEAAVRALRELVGQGRLLLFGHPTLEPLSRKMLEFGVDDYVVTPASPVELQQMFGVPPLRVASPPPVGPVEPSGQTMELVPAAPDRVASLLGLPLAELVLESLQEHPHAALPAAIDAINVRIGPALRLVQCKPAEMPPAIPEGHVLISHSVWVEKAEKASLHLTIPRDDDQATARHFLAQLAHLAARLIALQDRHVVMQQLAITDELTGLYNSRYFRHYLKQICADARQRRFLVTLLLFDLDNFKQYNDEFGHALGDDILRETASLMKKCCRPHDRVFRIAGDEFAVVFCEKEPPRQPHDPGAAGTSRVPESVAPILDRFRRSISSAQFARLGATGKGALTISGGLAVFPFDASTPEGLVEAADRALMFGAKRSGKNSIYLVGGSESQ